MKRVLVWLVVLAMVFGALAIAGRNREAVDPVLAMVGIDTESVWFEVGLKFVLYVIVGGPILGMLSAIFALGANHTSNDMHGCTVLRLKPGVRYFLPFTSLAMAALMYVASADAESPWTAAVFNGFGFAFLLCGWAIWRARIRFDGSRLFMRGFLGGEVGYDWADLQHIQRNANGVEYRLGFRDNKTVKISHYYSGLHRLIWLATEKRHENARTP